ncbi:hypothetical protein HMPREF3034_01253 [Prevotella sp. DNF00663]|nr:hypothetical protein HMPREF3034_01253 [Prevotella sp. DNF00663]
MLQRRDSIVAKPVQQIQSEELRVRSGELVMVNSEDFVIISLCFEMGNGLKCGFIV